MTQGPTTVVLALPTIVRRYAGRLGAPLIAVTALAVSGIASGQSPSPPAEEVLATPSVAASDGEASPALPDGFAKRLVDAFADATHVLEALERTTYESLPLPLRDPVTLQTSRNAGPLVRFDHGTETEHHDDFASPPTGTGPVPSEITPHAPMPPAVLEPAAFNPLRRVERPWEQPDYRRHVKLYFEIPGRGGGACSGTLIDSFHVLTAGHCLYHYETQQWTRNLRVAVAYENGYTPYNVARGVHSWAWHGWMYYRDFNHDVGLLRIDRPVGGAAGWQGFGGVPRYTGGNGFELLRCHLVPKRAEGFDVPGYPAAGSYAPGQLMYTHQGDWDGCPDYTPWYYGPAVAGQSGSGVMNIDDIAFGVMTHGYSDGRGGHTLITNPKFDVIYGAIEEVTPERFDLVPLVVRTGRTAFTAGDRLEDLSFYVHNLSREERTARVDIDLHLVRTDGASRHYLGSAVMDTTFRPKHIYRVSAGTVASIPYNVAGGRYHVVVELRSSADSDASNNITLPPDTAIIDVAPAPGRLQLGTRPTADVDTLPGQRDVTVLRLVVEAPVDGPDLNLTDLALSVTDLLGTSGTGGSPAEVLAGARVLLDANGLGHVADAEPLSELTPMGDGNVARVALGEPLQLRAGDRIDLLVTLDVAPSALATRPAGPRSLAAVPALPAALLLGTLAYGTSGRRRLYVLARRLLLLTIVTVPLLVACDGTRPEGPDDDDGGGVPTRQYAFATHLIDITGTAAGGPVETSGLPLEGATVRITRP
jgi:V8-like Glu-specific endopeptidase